MNYLQVITDTKSKCLEGRKKRILLNIIKYKELILLANFFYFITSFDTMSCSSYNNIDYLILTRISVPVAHVNNNFSCPVRSASRLNTRLNF